VSWNSCIRRFSCAPYAADEGAWGYVGIFIRATKILGSVSNLTWEVRYRSDVCRIVSVV